MRHRTLRFRDDQATSFAFRRTPAFFAPSPPAPDRWGGEGAKNASQTGVPTKFPEQPVLYYPDNPARKLMRKVVKKYKKICRSMKLTNLLGVKHMVPPAEYEANLVRMTQLLRASGVPVIYLVESPPHVDESRNIYLRQYNQIMANIARSQSHCRLIQCFDCLYEDLAGNLLDGTHLSDAGHTLISDRLIAAHMDGPACSLTNDSGGA